MDNPWWNFSFSFNSLGLKARQDIVLLVVSLVNPGFAAVSAVPTPGSDIFVLNVLVRTLTPRC